MQTIQVITSALNEEECLPEFYARIKSVFERHPQYAWSLLVCDNGSTDNTWSFIHRLSQDDPRVRGIRMSRTFSLDAAFTMGLDESDTDAVVLMASDLQDEPEVIEQFIELWEQGFDQVVARVRKKNEVPPVRRLLSKVFYLLANRLTQNMIPRNVSDFRLMSRNTYFAVRGLRERHRFLRGLIAWTGFKTGVVEIDRPHRYAGDSKYEKVKLWKVTIWASSAILSHTTIPLSIIAVSGLVLSMTSLVSTLILAVFWFLYGVPFAGYGTIVGLISMSLSLILLSLGVIAQYIGLIYEEVKARPIYVKAEDTKF